MKKTTKTIFGALTFAALLCGYVYADAITLKWSPNTSNTDTSQITDLASFNVYARSDTNFVAGFDIVTNLSNGVISSPTGVEVYLVPLDVPSNTWLTVTSLDASGNESGFAIPALYADGATFDIPLPPTQLIITKP